MSPPRPKGVAGSIRRHDDLRVATAHLLGVSPEEASAGLGRFLTLLREICWEKVPEKLDAIGPVLETQIPGRWRQRANFFTDVILFFLTCLLRSTLYLLYIKNSQA